METITVREIMGINEFKGECANEYKTRYEYILNGAFEKDYFAAWLESCSDYPSLNEIIKFCQDAAKLIDKWVYAVEYGYIEPNDGWDM